MHALFEEPALRRALGEKSGLVLLVGQDAAVLESTLLSFGSELVRAGGRVLGLFDAVSTEPAFRTIFTDPVRGRFLCTELADVRSSDFDALVVEWLKDRGSFLHALRLAEGALVVTSIRGADLLDGLEVFAAVGAPWPQAVACLRLIMMAAPENRARILEIGPEQRALLLPSKGTKEQLRSLAALLGGSDSG